VKRDDRQADDRDRANPQPYQRRHQDHAPPNHPDDAGEQIVREVEVERPRHANDGELEQHQPHAPKEQEARQIGVFAAVEKRARARQENERGATKCVTSG